MSYPFPQGYGRESGRINQRLAFVIQRMSSRRGGSGGGIPAAASFGGFGGGWDQEKVFFDDGQVRVTESLVTLGPPWNKVFAVGQLRGVTHGANWSADWVNVIYRLVGLGLILAGAVSWGAGFPVGCVAGVATGIGLLWGQGRSEAPYCVTLDFGDVWARECLSTANGAWAAAVADAVAEAMRNRGEGPGLIPGPGKTRN